jgi:hypothetical protein
MAWISSSLAFPLLVPVSLLATEAESPEGRGSADGALLFSLFFLYVAPPDAFRGVELPHPQSA